MKDQFLATNPTLPVISVIDTAKFFEKNLGFTIELLWENPSYGVVKRGNSVIEFGEARKDHAVSGICW